MKLTSLASNTAFIPNKCHRSTRCAMGGHQAPMMRRPAADYSCISASPQHWTGHTRSSRLQQNASSHKLPLANSNKIRLPIRRCNTTRRAMSVHAVNTHHNGGGNSQKNGLNPIPAEKPYDVIVVGSGNGACGFLNQYLAKQSNPNLRVAVVEEGKPFFVTSSITHQYRWTESYGLGDIFQLHNVVTKVKEGKPVFSGRARTQGGGGSINYTMMYESSEWLAANIGGTPAYWTYLKKELGEKFNRPDPKKKMSAVTQAIVAANEKFGYADANNSFANIPGYKEPAINGEANQKLYHNFTSQFDSNGMRTNSGVSLVKWDDPRITLFTTTKVVRLDIPGAQGQIGSARPGKSQSPTHQTQAEQQHSRKNGLTHQPGISSNGSNSGLPGSNGLSSRLPGLNGSSIGLPGSNGSQQLNGSSVKAVNNGASSHSRLYGQGLPATPSSVRCTAVVVQDVSNPQRPSDPYSLPLAEGGFVVMCAGAGTPKLLHEFRGKLGNNSIGKHAMDHILLPTGVFLLNRNKIKISRKDVYIPVFTTTYIPRKDGSTAPVCMDYFSGELENLLWLVSHLYLALLLPNFIKLQVIRNPKLFSTVKGVVVWLLMTLIGFSNWLFPHEDFTLVTSIIKFNPEKAGFYDEKEPGRIVLPLFEGLPSSDVEVARGALKQSLRIVREVGEDIPGWIAGLLHLFGKIPFTEDQVDAYVDYYKNKTLLTEQHMAGGCLFGKALETGTKNPVDTGKLKGTSNVYVADLSAVPLPRISPQMTAYLVGYHVATQLCGGREGARSVADTATNAATVVGMR